MRIWKRSMYVLGQRRCHCRHSRGEHLHNGTLILFPYFISLFLLSFIRSLLPLLAFIYDIINSWYARSRALALTHAGENEFKNQTSSVCVCVCSVRAYWSIFPVMGMSVNNKCIYTLVAERQQQHATHICMFARAMRNDGIAARKMRVFFILLFFFFFWLVVIAIVAFERFRWWRICCIPPHTTNDNNNNSNHCIGEFVRLRWIPFNVFPLRPFTLRNFVCLDFGINAPRQRWYELCARVCVCACRVFLFLSVGRRVDLLLSVHSLARGIFSYSLVCCAVWRLPECDGTAIEYSCRMCMFW